MKPAFLRLPGGDYLEGSTIAGRFNWKNTIGPLEAAPATRAAGATARRTAWACWSSWSGARTCTCSRCWPSTPATRKRTSSVVAPGTALQPYVQDALDEIQYVTGDTSTTWGAERAADGHPAPFPLTYVEIGNED